MIKIIHDEASKITTEPNEVMVDGPDGVDVSLTPRAAVRLAEGLTVKAAEAVGKQAFADEIGRRLLARTRPRQNNDAW